METKECLNCGEVKPINSFHKNSKGKFGRAQKCKPCFNSVAKEYRETNICKITAKKYNISEKKAKNLLKTTACCVCGDEDQRLCIDHCHTTGVVRGVLCQTCNTALGMVKDDSNRLRQLASYLERNTEID